MPPAQTPSSPGTCRHIAVPSAEQGRALSGDWGLGTGSFLFSGELPCLKIQSCACFHFYTLL